MDGSKLKIGVVVARWNPEYTDPLRAACLQALADSGVKENHIAMLEVPGSYELSYGAAYLIRQGVDAVVCIGCLIKGETMHFEYIAEAVTQGITKLNIETKTPVIFGVLTCLTADQAAARTKGDNNHGYWWGLSAVEMGLLKK